MTPRYPPHESSVPCTLLTLTTMYSGRVTSPFRLLSETLNASDRTFFALTNCTARSLTGDGKIEVDAGTAILRKASVIMALPAHGEEEREQISHGLAGGHGLMALVKAGQFLANGTIMLPPGPRLPEYLMESTWGYIPVLDATLVHQAGAFPELQAACILINRNVIDAIFENVKTDRAPDLQTLRVPPPWWVPPTGRPDEPGVEQPGLDQVEFAIDAETAQQVLLGTDVFEDADPDRLLELVAELTQAGGIIQVILPSGTEVVTQGAIGDTLYIVQRGQLEVLYESSPGAPTVIASLGPGEIFGEMAFLGNRRRTASVRSVSEVQLMVLPAASWKELAAKLPNVTGKLIRIMTRRGSPSGGLLGRWR